MLGSLIFTFCGFNLLHFVHPNAVAVIAHIPWLLWCIDIVLCDGRWTRVISAQAGIALLTGSQLLLGYPQYVWFSLLAELGYALYTISCRRHEPRVGCFQGEGCLDCVGCGTRTWPRLILAKGLGVLLGGVQLWPTLDALRHSTRQVADAAFAQVGSVHPLNLIQLVAPYLFSGRVLGGGTHEMSLYIGAVPLMLIAWLVIQRRNLGPLRPLARATTWFGAFALLLAMGQYGFLYRLQAYVPLVSRFRCPCRYLVLFHLAAAVLAAMGFMLLARTYQQCRDGKASRLNPLYPGVHQHTFVPLAKFEGLWAVVLVGATAALVGLLRQQPCLHCLAAERVGRAGPADRRGGGRDGCRPRNPRLAGRPGAAGRGRSGLLWHVLRGLPRHRSAGASPRGHRHAAGRSGRPRLRPAPAAGRPVQGLHRRPDGPGRMVSRRRLRRLGTAAPVGLCLAAGLASGGHRLGAARGDHVAHPGAGGPRRRLAGSAPAAAPRPPRDPRGRQPQIPATTLGTSTFAQPP